MDVRIIASYLQAEDRCHVGITQLPQRLPAAPHTHDFFEVFWLRSGSCRHLINGGEQQLQTGQLVFIRPADAHRFQATTDDASLLNLALPTACVKRLRRRYGNVLRNSRFWHEADLPPAHNLSGEALEMVNVAADELGLTPADELKLDYLLLLLFRLTQSTPVTDDNAPAPLWLQEAMQRIAEPVFFRQGATGLIQAAGRGHEHVCRMTKRHYGKTPSELINSVRCDYAARQLADSRLPITEISEVCGFDSPSHFFKLFKQHYSQTPRQYRLKRQQAVV